MRRGVGLIHLVAGLFVSGLVMAIAVPLFLAAQRQSEQGIVRAKMGEAARSLSFHLGEDVRQSVRVELLGAGTGLRLTLARPDRPGVRDRIVYRSTPTGLQRDLAPGAPGRAAETQVFSGPGSTLVRFDFRGGAVRAQMFFEKRISGRTLSFSSECSASPRSGLSGSSAGSKGKFYFYARVTDPKLGVESVWIQIKDPDAGQSRPGKRRRL